MKNFSKNKGMVIWLTGLPCSGKTTISKKLEKYFLKKHLPVQILDGDSVRKNICKDLGFSKADRDKNIERVAYIAQMLANNKINVIISFVSPYKRMRAFARKICPNFVEVYVKCSIEECIRRDAKGMYKKALAGKIKDFTGIQDPYEEPKTSEVILETDKNSAQKCVSELISYIKK